MTILVNPPKKNPAPVPTPSPVLGTGAIGATGGGIPIMAGSFIPPNGLAGFMQQTPAVQALYRRGKSGGGGRRRRKSAKKAVVAKATRRVKRAGKRLAKGSAAAKRRMAQLRKMRRK